MSAGRGAYVTVNCPRCGTEVQCWVFPTVVRYDDAVIKEGGVFAAVNVSGARHSCPRSTVASAPQESS